MLHFVKGLGAGGAERLLVSLAGVGDHDRFSYEVAYLLPWKQAFVPALETAGVRTRCLGGRRGVADLRWVARLARLIRTGGYDVVHLHSPLPGAVARSLIRTMPRARRPRVVSTEHNVWWSHVAPTRWVNTATFPWGDAWLAVSTEVMSSIPERLRQRVEIVIHGIELDKMQAPDGSRDEVRRELGMADDDIVMVTVANFRRQKAYPNLLHAARIVVDRQTTARFVVVGQGPLEDEVRALRRELGLDERVRLLGYRDDVGRVLSGCDVFVMASDYEGYPLAVMEAFAAGLPVAGTAVGGMTEAVVEGRAGHLAPARDPEALADAILRLSGDEQARARMGAYARNQAEGYDIVHAARRIEQLYLDLAGS